MMSQPTCEVKTTQLNTHPFKNMKRIRSHSDGIFDSTSVLYPDGSTKIFTCARDNKLRIFDLKKLKCEKIINHLHKINSVHFYKEEQLLMTTDIHGDLCFWNLFSPEIKIIKKVKISKPESILWKLTQVSSNLFFCCVQYGRSQGCLYSIKLRNKINDIKVEEIEYPLINTFNSRKEYLRCIYKLISEENSIIFSGGYPNDYTVKKYNFESKKHFAFPKKHTRAVFCLTSFINEKNEEVVLSGGFDRKIQFWKLLNGENIKEVEFNGGISCFLNDFRRNFIFFTTGYPCSDQFLYSLDLKTEKILRRVEKVHNGGSASRIYCLKWIDTENSEFQKLISCSQDSTFNIYELEKLPDKYESKDLKERISFIRDDEDFINKYFDSENNKKMIFSIALWDNKKIQNIFKVLLV